MMVRAALDRLGNDLGRVTSKRLKAFGGQLGWSLAARVVAALLQMVVIPLLARGLPPSSFAFVSAMNVVLTIVVAMNGFGLNRQIQFRRSRLSGAPAAAELFARRLRYSYGSAIVWLVFTVAGGI